MREALNSLQEGTYQPVRGKAGQFPGLLLRALLFLLWRPESMISALRTKQLIIKKWNDSEQNKIRVIEAHFSTP